ncbi:MAG TPA: hypothetical protein VGQ83_22205 [Polyangia bacterium]|jgi:hypothetical protein
MIWPPQEVARDLAAVDALLAERPGAGAAARREAAAAYFDGRYGAGGPRVFALFARLCAYLARHEEELRDRGLLDLVNRGTPDPTVGVNHGTVDARFLGALLPLLEAGAEPTVAEVPARDVPDDAVEP